MYEPQDFYQEYRVLPDFKLSIDGKSYYVEHLGDMNHRPYRERWAKKWRVYNNHLKIGDIIVTTEEKDGNIDKGIESIISDIKNGNLKQSQNSYSEHHYLL